MPAKSHLIFQLQLSAQCYLQLHVDHPGPNAIPYTVSSWLQLIGEEFSTYLYVYQFTFFSVWLWFSALVRHRQPAMPND